MLVLHDASMQADFPSMRAVMRDNVHLQSDQHGRMLI